jgi:autotransporter-associated beta strand protein
MYIHLTPHNIGLDHLDKFAAIGRPTMRLRSHAALLATFAAIASVFPNTPLRAAANLSWTGNDPVKGFDPTWSTGGVDSNWSVVGAGGVVAAATFNNGDNVTFGAVNQLLLPGIFAPATTAVVVQPAGVSPGSVTFTSTPAPPLGPPVPITYSISGGPISDFGGVPTTLTTSAAVLYLDSPNTYTGGTTLSGGVLNLTHVIVATLVVDGLGSGPLTVTAGSISAIGPSTVNNALILQGDLKLDPSAGLLAPLTFAGPVSLQQLSTNIVFGLTGQLATISGIISDGGAPGPARGLFIDGSNGANILTLSGANTYRGGTTINGATVSVQNDAALGTGDLTVSTLGATLGTGGAGSRTLANNIDLGSTLFLNDKAGETITLKGTISSSTLVPAPFLPPGLNIQAGGAVLLSGNNNYEGNTTVTGGTLQIGSNTALGDSVLNVLAPGAVNPIPTIQAFGAARTLDNSINLGGTLTVGGAQNLTFSNVGTVTISAATAGVNTTAGGVTTTFAGVIQDGVPAAGLFVKSGPGTLLVTNNNTFTGGTLINGGILRVTNAGAAINGLGTGQVIVNNGGTLAGRGRVGGKVICVPGGIISPDDPSTLSMDQLSLSDGAQLDLQLNAPNLVGDAGGSDLLAVTTDLTLGGTLGVVPLSQFGDGTYTLITYGGALSFNNGETLANAITFGDMPVGFSYQIGNTAPAAGNPGAITLIVTPEPASLTLLSSAAVGLFSRRRRN